MDLAAIVGAADNRLNCLASTFNWSRLQADARAVMRGQGN